MSTALEDYKRQVYKVAIEVKEQEGWCSGGFEDALEKLDLLEYHKTYVAEPPGGSVVLHPYRSIAYMKLWGGGKWTTTDPTRRADHDDELTWAAIVTKCDGRPIVLLHTGDAEQYPVHIEGIQL